MADDDIPSRVGNREIYASLQDTNSKLGDLSKQVAVLTERLPERAVSIKEFSDLEKEVNKLKVWRGFLTGGLVVVGAIATYASNLLPSFQH